MSIAGHTKDPSESIQGITQCHCLDLFWVCGTLVEEYIGNIPRGEKSGKKMEYFSIFWPKFSMTHDSPLKIDVYYQDSWQWKF